MLAGLTSLRFAATSHFFSTTSSRLAAFVQDLLKVLAALPDSAFAEESTLDRKAWDKAVRGAVDIAALRDALGELQSAVRDDRLSQHFARTPLLVKGAWMETGTPWLETSSSLASVDRLLRCTTDPGPIFGPLPLCVLRC